MPTPTPTPSDWYNPTLPRRGTLATAEEVSAEFLKIQAAFDMLGPPSGIGQPGVANFMWIAYADSFDGTANFTTGEAGERRYIGIATNKTTPVESSEPKDYIWQRIAGASAPQLLVQWSADGLTGWHEQFEDGDLYQRQSTDGGQTWGPAIRAVGEGAGVDGVTYAVAFKRSLLQPDTPVSSANPPPGWTDGPTQGVSYLWQVNSRFRGNAQLSAWTVPVRISGEDGEDGVNGNDGQPGEPGLSRLIHVAYADSADGSVNFTTGAVGGRLYIGILVDGNLSDSPNFADYTWTRLTGINGTDGTDGTPGANGYVHFAYANSADGSVDFTTGDGAGRSFIGIYSDNTLADSNDYQAYTWSRVQAPQIRVTASPGVAQFSSGNAYVGGDITFTARHQNSKAVPVFTYANLSGAGSFAGTAAAFAAASPTVWATSDPDILTLKAGGVSGALDVGPNGFIMIASVPDATDQVTLVKLRSGADSINGILSNESHTLPAQADGTITSYSGASGTVQVFAGAADVSSLFALSTAPGGNQQELTVSYNARSYAVTGGFDALESSATLVIRLTGSGAYDGVIIDKAFALAKSVAGAGATSPALISLTASSLTARFNAANQYAGGSIVLNATRQNSSAAIVWALYDANNNLIFGFAAASDFVATNNPNNPFWTSTGPSNLGLTPAGIETIIASNGNQFTLAAGLSGTSLSDRASITKVKDGTNGSNGNNGNDGANGVDGFIVDTETVAFVQPVFSSGASKPIWTGGSGTIKLIKGGARVTAGVSYAVVSPVNMASLTLSGDTFSFAGAAAEKGSFVIRASFAGVPYERVVTVTKVFDGEAAFRGSTNLSATNGGGVTTLGNSTTTVPGSRGCTLSAVCNYTIQENASGSFQGRVYLYWRNVTDNGPLNLLGFQDGSIATVVNNGTVSEPQWARTPGTVSASFSFPSPVGDKAIYFEARLERISGDRTAIATGSMKLEVSS